MDTCCDPVSPIESPSSLMGYRCPAIQEACPETTVEKCATSCPDGNREVNCGDELAPNCRIFQKIEICFGVNCLHESCINGAVLNADRECVTPSPRNRNPPLEDLFEDLFFNF